MLRKTKIVVTAGPACAKKGMLEALVRAGADVFRINASHTDPAALRRWIQSTRQAGVAAGKSVAVMVDLQGPRVRTGRLAGPKTAALKSGARLAIAVSRNPGTGALISTACAQFPRMVKAGDPVLIDNGYLELEVLAVRKKWVECRVVRGGVLGENKGINLPNAPVTLPALGPKDKQDLEVAAQMNVDYIALSFVRSEQDILTLKDWLARRGRCIPIIAKIEKPHAVERIQAIAAASDAIMIARGDLGIELGVEKVPLIQKKIVQEANATHIPVITATQMLESMMEHARPTRAEASDVANAVWDGTDAVMLSGETAIGRYPLEAVRVMSRIILEAERAMGEIQAPEALAPKHPETDQAIYAITHAARHAAKDLKAKAIVVFTRSGKSAGLVCKFRPVSPIIAFTPGERINRRLALLRGVYPYTLRYWKSTDAILREADQSILRLGLLKPGACVVVLSGKQAIPGARYMTKIHRIGEA